MRNRIWLDVDGVLADFCSHTIKYAKGLGITDPKEFPQRSKDVKLWEFGPAFGKVWDVVKGDTMFWSTIPSMPFTRPFYTSDLAIEGYISSRPCPVFTTETWLYFNGYTTADVRHIEADTKADYLVGVECTHYLY